MPLTKLLYKLSAQLLVLLASTSLLHSQNSSNTFCCQVDFRENYHHSRVVDLDAEPHQLIYCKQPPDSLRLRIYNRWADCLIDIRDSLDLFDFNALKVEDNPDVIPTDEDFVFPTDVYVYVAKFWRKGKFCEYTGTFTVMR